MNFSEWLQRQLDDRGWSQNELGKRSGISGSQVSMVLTGRRAVTFEFSKAVAEALDIPPEQVLRRAGLLDPLPPEVEIEGEVIQLLRNLSQSARYVVLEILRVLAAQPSCAEPGVSYETHRPRTPSERQDSSLTQVLEALGPDDRELVFTFIKRLLGDPGRDDMANLHFR